MVAVSLKKKITYSEEEGTWGANNLKDTVREKEKQERYLQLMELQSKISLNYNLSRTGQNELVLIDNFNDGVFVGRSQNESPEVDGEILIAPDRLHSEADAKKIIGTFAHVTIENADEYDLMAKFL